MIFNQTNFFNKYGNFEETVLNRYEIASILLVWEETRVHRGNPLSTLQADHLTTSHNGVGNHITLFGKLFLMVY